MPALTPRIWCRNFWIVCEITDSYFLECNFAGEITKGGEPTPFLEQCHLFGCIFCPIEEGFLVLEDHALALRFAFAVHIDAVVVAPVGVVALHPVVLHANLHCAYLFEAGAE